VLNSLGPASNGFIGVNYCHVAMMNTKLSCQGQRKDPTVT
jgi:hypothetical protein